MSEVRVPERQTISEQILLSRLQQSEQMREFFIQMWMQNPELAKQGGAKVQCLLTRLDQVDAIDQVSVSSGAGMTKQHGISLLELIVFIVIISVALTGILLVMNLVMKHSADPVVHKQALAIAESLLEEVELMPFTYCDPDDASAVTATSAVVGVGGCSATLEGLGPETIGGVKEDRYGNPAPTAVNAYFDNVNDYNGFSMAAGAVLDINKNPAVSGYSASIVVAPTQLGTIASTESLLITVSVIGPDGVPIQLDGYRTRYAPNSVP
jgi:MSHA pilin protein MshD